MHPIWTLLRASALAVALFFLAAWAMAQPHAHLLGDGERIALDDINRVFDRLATGDAMRDVILF